MNTGMTQLELDRLNELMGKPLIHSTGHEIEESIELLHKRHAELQADIEVLNKCKSMLDEAIAEANK